MSSFRDLLAKAKSEIREVDTATADDMRRLPGTVLLDVREPDEYEQGALPGALHIPRGHLEIARSRGKIAGSRHAARRLLRRWCPVGVRGQDACRARLHRRRVDGRWIQQVEERGSRVGRAHDAHRRPAQPLPAPPPAPRGGRGGSDRSCSSAKVLLLGAGGLGSPAALYLAAAGVGTLGIIDMDVVDESNLQRQILHNIDRIGDRKVDSAKKTLTLLNPDVERRHLRHAPRRRQRARHHRRLRRDRRRHRQLPDRATCSTTRR